VNYTSEQWNGDDALAALGIDQLGARLYDPTIGRFVSRDPLFDPGNLNAYAFAANDPVNGSDPSGMDDTTNVITKKCEDCGQPSGGHPPGGSPASTCVSCGIDTVHGSSNPGNQGDPSSIGCHHAGCPTGTSSKSQNSDTQAETDKAILRLHPSLEPHSGYAGGRQYIGDVPDTSPILLPYNDGEGIDKLVRQPWVNQDYINRLVEAGKRNGRSREDTLRLLESDLWAKWTASHLMGLALVKGAGVTRSPDGRTPQTPKPTSGPGSGQCRHRWQPRRQWRGYFCERSQLEYPRFLGRVS